MRTFRLGFVLLLLTAGLAGCFGDDAPPAERSATASGGRVSDGWAYDGVGVVDAAATLEGFANNPDNTGAYNVSFEYAGSTWTVRFDQFGGSEDFKDGGVVFDLLEHGETGVSSAAVPKLFAKVAVWGTATVLRDGAPAPDPAGAEGPWSAHLMLSDTTVRGADGRILKADGQTPYDPASPADATRVEGDPQALLSLVAPSGPESARAPENVSTTVQFQGPQASTQTVEIPVGAYGEGMVNVTIPAQGVTVGEVSVRILDPAGNVTAEDAAQVTPNQGAAFSFALPTGVGSAVVEITGQGSFTAEVDGSFRYGDHPFLVITWDDFKME